MRTKFDSNICFIDFETSGIDVYRDFPIQIGAYLVDRDLNPIKEFTSYIRLPKNKIISEGSFKIHNISREDLLNEPTARKVLKNFFNTLGTDFCLAGWNISFDISIMRLLCSKYKLMDSFNSLNYRHIDVQTICSLLRQNSIIDKDIKSLSDCAGYFNISRNKSHNALEDSKITYKVFKRLLDAIQSHVII